MRHEDEKLLALCRKYDACVCEIISLLKDGADPEASGNSVTCALSHAASNDDLGIVNMLINAGAAKSISSLSRVMDAQSNNPKLALKGIIPRLAALNSDLFIELCEKGYVNDVAGAIKAGANPSMRDVRDALTYMMDSKYNDGGVWQKLCSRVEKALRPNIVKKMEEMKTLTRFFRGKS